MSLRRETLADQVAQGIVDFIHEGGLKPATPIDSEGALAERFGVNKLVVREAIRTLTARGILHSSQGRTAQVSMPTSDVLAQLFDFHMRQRSFSFRDLLVTRRLVEGELAALAAQRAVGGADLSPLERAVSDMRQATSDMEVFIEADLRFHRETAACADNSLLCLILESLNGLLLEGRRKSFRGRAARGDDQAATVAAHAAILDAIRSGDAGDARLAMHRHLADTWEDLRREAAQGSDIEMLLDPHA